MDRRKIVLATNVAETSVTVEGVTGVVDTGLARTLTFDAGVGLDRLRLTPISRASADQRAGRAGRTRPGVCVRLWSEAAQRGRPEQTEPEIRRVDLAGAVLQLLCLGETDVSRFPWLEPPPEATVAQALLLLRRLGAVDDNGVTRVGADVWPGCRFIRGWPGCLSREGAAAAPERAAPDRRSAGGARSVCARLALPLRVAAKQSRHGSGLGCAGRMWKRWRSLSAPAAIDSPSGTLNRGAARFTLRARDQLLRSLRSKFASLKCPAHDPADEAVLRSLLAAFPDRLARRREAGSRRGVMVGGRGVCLAPSSGVTESELFLCIDVDAGRTETLVRQASAVERDWLPPELMSVAVEVEFDAADGAGDGIGGASVSRIWCLTKCKSPCRTARKRRASWRSAAGQRLDRVLPSAGFAGRPCIARASAGCASGCRSWNCRSFDESDLRDLLSWLCVRSALLRGVAGGRLAVSPARPADAHSQRQAVEREAPERLSVPSGSRIALRYEPGKPPVLAVRIQEMFGLPETPRIAGGRVGVVLHLLAPNYRPQQVTDDLASFWTNTYPQVRKELRGRYPKHAWPEDPWTAPAERRSRRKGGL